MNRYEEKILTLTRWYVPRIRGDGISVQGIVSAGHYHVQEGHRVYTTHVQNVQIDGDALIIKTRNSKYRAAYEDHNTQINDEKRLAELFGISGIDPDAAMMAAQRIKSLSQEAELRHIRELAGKFEGDGTIFEFAAGEEHYIRGYLTRKGRKTRSRMDYDLHVGMFQDSVLLSFSYMPGEMYYDFDFRFFPYKGNRIEFYDWADPYEPVYFYNSGIEAIEADTPNGQFLLPAGETVLISKENTDHQIEDPIAPAVDRYSVFESNVYSDGAVTYGAPDNAGSVKMIDKPLFDRKDDVES